MRRRQDNKIILIDFGSVKQVSTQIIDTTGQVKQTVAVGTKSYMPMEQMMGRPGFYSDIYALGVIAIQALTGADPREFAIDDNGEIVWRNKLDRKIHYQPRFLDLLDQMVRYRHQERYTSAGVVLSDLRQLDAAQNNDKDTLIIPKNVPQSKSQQSQTAPNLNGETVVLHPPIAPKESQEAQASQAAAQVKVTDASSFKSFPSVPDFAFAKSSKSRSRSRSGSKAKKTKILFPLILGLLSLLAAFGGWVWIKQRGEQPEVEMSLYENDNQGFRVDYPQSWAKQSRDDFWATGAVFFSPLENDQDQFKEQVSVLVENLPKDLALSKYTEQSLSEIKQLSDPSVGDAQKITLGTNEGRQVVYRGEENGSPVQRMQTWSVNGDRAYVITYTAVPESYDNYLPTVEKMIKSFETIE
jgi:serine/threonine protein kinase